VSRARRALNQVRRLINAVDEAKAIDLDALGNDELVELEPGVWGRPPRAGGLEGELERVERLINGIERVRDTARGRYHYGAASKRRGRR
jgi:hypothetical protein